MNAAVTNDASSTEVPGTYVVPAPKTDRERLLRQQLRSVAKGWNSEKRSAFRRKLRNSRHVSSEIRYLLEHPSEYRAGEEQGLLLALTLALAAVNARLAERREAAEVRSTPQKAGPISRDAHSSKGTGARLQLVPSGDGTTKSSSEPRGTRQDGKRHQGPKPGASPSDRNGPTAS